MTTKFGGDQPVGKIFAVMVNGKTEHLEVANYDMDSLTCKQCAFIRSGRWAQDNAIVTRHDKMVQMEEGENYVCYDQVGCTPDSRTDDCHVLFIRKE